MNISFYLIREFESMAINVLRNYDNHTRNALNHIIVLNYVPHLKHDYLDLAIECSCQEYLSENTVQSVLKDMWTGSSASCNDMVIKYYN